MKKNVYIIVNEHFDLVWRRCFERDFIFQNQNFVSYADLQGYYIEDNIAYCDKYDFYGFRIESVAVLEKFLERNPHFFGKIKQLIEEGRLTIPFAGHNIVDSNMVCGESIIRNYLYGYNYLKDNFSYEPYGIDRCDAFGNSAQLPQIARGFGKKWIYNISYSACEKPYWRGLDSSTVYVYNPEAIGYTGGYYKYRPCPACNGFKEDCEVCGGRGIDTAFMEKMRVRLKEITPKESKIPGLIVCSGEEILPCDDIVNWYFENKEKYDISFVGHDAYLPYIQEKLDVVDEVPDDMVHPSAEINVNNTGCYVTRIKTKQSLRSNENAVLSTESICVADFIKNGNYPYNELNSIWNKMLFTSFHDSVTATVVDAAYAELMNYAGDISTSTAELRENAIKHLTYQKDGVLSVYNPYGFKLTSDVTVVLNTEADVFISDEDDAKVSISEYYRDENGLEITFTVKDIEPFSTKIYKINNSDRPFETEYNVIAEINCFNGSAVLTNDAAVNENEVGEDIVIENENFKITAATNGIKEIFDKRLNRIIAKEGTYMVGEWILEHDEGSPWATLSPDMRRFALKDHTTLISTETTKDTQKLTFAITAGELDAYGVLSFDITYNVILQSGCDMVKFSADVGWNTQNHRLRIAMPTVGASRHFYDIPYGVIERSPYEPNILLKNGASNWASAAGDYPAINWAGVQNENYSLVLFNKGTPSYMIDDTSTIYLSVLRSPSVGTYLHSPTEYTMTDYDGMRDSGGHHFEYAIKAYNSGFAENSAVLDGIAYNSQLCCNMGIINVPSLPIVDCSDAVVSSIKLSTDRKGIIYRIYEYHGKNSVCSIKLPEDFAFKAIYETNMKEESKKVLEFNGLNSKFNISPFEIKTIYIEL